MNLKDLDKKYVISPGSKIALRDIRTEKENGITKEEAQAQTEKNLKRIAELQALLYSEGKRSLLIVFQAMDAGGKDGSIKAIGGAMNPQGCHVASFKSPSKEELAHDFLWRVHKHAPAKGDVAIFNRSHYEDVLIARVDNLVPKEVWKKRYDQINNFEEMLAEGGTHILKFFLHISKEEQLERFADRLNDPAKNWKIGPADFDVREKWDDYQEAYEDAISKCSTDHAPWFVIPADTKWFRDLVISQIIVDYMEGLNMKPPAPTVDVEAIRKKYFGGNGSGIKSQFKP